MSNFSAGMAYVSQDRKANLKYHNEFRGLVINSSVNLCFKAQVLLFNYDDAD